MKTPKRKTETITVAVEMEITYEPSRKGAREHVINCAVRETPRELGGASIEHGCYSVRHVKTFLTSEPV